MRTFAFIGAAAIAGVIASSGAWAWTAEQPAQQQQPGANTTDLSDPENFKALQERVNGNSNTIMSQGGFTFSGSAGNTYDGQGSGNPYGIAPLGRNSGFNYSPNPGFRGQ